MKNTIVVIIVLLLIVLGIYYFVSKSNYSAPMPVENSQTTTPPVVNNQQNTPPVGGTTATPPASVSVNIKNFVFGPATLNIKVGTKVTWTNNDNVAHTVTSDSGSMFDSGTLSPGESFSFTFTNPGSVSYHCNIHPMMKASVTVS